MTNTTKTRTLDNGVVVETETRSATYTGRGEFYSGLNTGDAVVLQTTTYVHPDGHRSVHYAVSKGGPWLAVYSLDNIA